MDVRPNRTCVEGRVLALRPEADGWGAEVDLEVTANPSADDDQDFLQPKPGTTMSFFSADPREIAVGRTVRVQASLRGGPKGTRAVIESTEPIDR